MRYLFALLFCALALMASPADARELRQPATGGPGFTVEVPDVWMSQVSGPNLLLGDDTRSVGFAIFVGHLDGPPDFDLLASAVRPPNATPLVRGEDTAIDGRTAAVFNATMSGNGRNASLVVIMVEVGGGYVGSVSQITASDASPEAISAAEAVRRSIQIVE